MNRLAFIIMPLLIFAMTIMIKLVIISFLTPKLRLSKNIKYDLKKAIKLDGDYSDLKLIFDKKERLDIIKNQDLYDFNADLSFVLEDMISDYYTSNKKDSLYVTELKYYLLESKDKHPFDKLDESQKELFITLRENAGDSYHLISENLLNISEELNDKNSTIEEYLDKSNQSYILAIIALFLAFIQILSMIWKRIKLYLKK